MIDVDWYSAVRHGIWLTTPYDRAYINLPEAERASEGAD
jgi:hypothetical protein